MRCKRCGTEVDGGALCDACAEIMPPDERLTSVAERARTLANAAWVCAVIALVAVFVAAPLSMCAGTVPVLKFAAIVIAFGFVCAISAAVLASRPPFVGLILSSGACMAVLLVCSMTGVMLLKEFESGHYPVQSKSLNNIKQLAIGVMTYSQDYQETFPGWVRNPDGEYAHNCWDEQINPSIKSKDVYNNGKTGIKSYSDPIRQRKLTYGLNGLLITPAKADFDGDADFGAVNAKHPPEPLTPSAIPNPAGTILFAELSTNTAMSGVYGAAPNPAPIVGTAPTGNGSEEWQGAWPGWIDISPRAFVETGPAAGSYKDPYATGVVDRGIARDLYGGGGVYAFCDGHVQFMKISKSVGLGTVVKGKTVTVENCWEAWNTNNMWKPG